MKRSLTLRGHRTSVSLEDAFWVAFRDIAATEGKAINQLAAEIDAERALDTGLASAIRVYILRRAQAGATGAHPLPDPVADPQNRSD